LANSLSAVLKLPTGAAASCASVVEARASGEPPRQSGRGLRALQAFEGRDHGRVRAALLRHARERGREQRVVR